MTSSPVSIDVGISSAIGRRSTNQDRVYADPTLLALFDGVGGRALGEVAAMLALAATVKTAAIDRVTSSPQVLKCLRAADRAVTRASDELGVDIATTAVVVMLSVRGNEVTCQVGWAGDSIALLIRQGGIVELTQMPGDIAETTPPYALTRWIGAGGSPPPRAVEHYLEAGDILVLASDGVTEVLNMTEIGLIAAQATSAQEAAGLITELAQDRSVNDNASVAVAFVLGTSPAPEPDTDLRDLMPVGRDDLPKKDGPEQ